jgi:hypothetical protein
MKLAVRVKRNPSSANLAQNVKMLELPSVVDKEGTHSVPTSLVIPVDPNVEPMLNYMPTYLTGTTIAGQAGTRYPIGAVVNAGASINGGQALATTAAEQYLYNPATFYAEPARTPTIFKHQLCTTVAATAVWTPAGGKKFRLMGYVITPAAGMAAAGIELITFLDNAAAITIAHQVYLPIAASIVNQPSIVVRLPGNGHLSTNADNVLNVTLTAAATAGAISVMVYGTEE